METKLENILETIGNVGLVTAEWTFTKAHLQAWLFLPIALQSMRSKDVEEDELKARKNRAYCKLRTFDLVSFLMSLVFFVGSLITGKFQWTISYSFVMMFLVSILLLSIRGIKKIIFNEKCNNYLESNSCLLGTYVVCFVTQVVILLFLQITSIMFEQVIKIDDTKKYCLYTIGFTISLWLQWLNITARAILSSYMNARFSKS